MKEGKKSIHLEEQTYTMATETTKLSYYKSILKKMLSVSSSYFLQDFI